MKKTAAHIYVSKIVLMTTHFLEKDPDIKKGKDLCCNFFFCHLLFTVGIIFFLLVALLLNPSAAIEPNSVSMMVNPIVTENVSTIVIVTT